MKESLSSDLKPDWSKMDGLVPAIVQDADTGRVLMLAYMNAKALQATIESGKAVFWSRSRKCLWKKGATSGNVLAVTRLALDCDGDAILVMARPSGPACHQGPRSCFLDDQTLHTFEFLPYLQETIRQRIETGTQESYVHRLSEKGESELARKVGEEAIEVILATHTNTQELVAECADLVFHLLVLINHKNLGFEQIVAELMARRRHTSFPQ